MINYTKKYFLKKLAKHKLKLTYIFVKNKYIVNTIKTLLRIKYYKLCSHFSNEIIEINQILISKLRQRNRYKQILFDTDKYIEFLIYLSKLYSKYQNIVEVLDPIKYGGGFDYHYKFAIMNIIGNCISNSRVKYNPQIIRHATRLAKYADDNKLGHLVPFFVNMFDNHQNYVNEVSFTRKYNYLLVRYVKILKYFTDQKYKNEEHILMCICLLKKLINISNNMIFFQNSGNIYLDKIYEKYNNKQIQLKILEIEDNLKSFFEINKYSLHKAVRFDNSLHIIKFIIMGTDLSYYIIDYKHRSVFNWAMKFNNKELIGFYIASGFNMEDFFNKRKFNNYLALETNKDPCFSNIVQNAFVIRKIHNNIINKVVKSYGFYNDINVIIKNYVDNIYEYIKNEDIIEKIINDKKLFQYNLY